MENGVTMMPNPFLEPLKIATWLWYMGMAKYSPLEVYWIEGLGYFEAPHALGFSNIEHQVYIYGLNTRGKYQYLALSHDNSEHNRRRIREMCEIMKGQRGPEYLNNQVLFGARAERLPWMNAPILEKSIEDVMVFNDTCPELIETTNT